MINTDCLRSEHDQELDSLLVGPIPVGVNKFIFEADSPNLKRIPTSEILGVTVILLSCSYDDREFVRVGYYVNNEYDTEEMNDDPPAKPVIEKVRRHVLAEKPRVTRFAIKWYDSIARARNKGWDWPWNRDSEDSAPAEFPPEQPEADVVEDDGTAYGAEEEELEAAEAGAVEGADAVQEDAEDEEMAGAEDTAGPSAPKAEDEESDAGSEDLEAESSGSEEEDIEEEEVEGDEDMEMGEDGEGAAHTEAGKGEKLQGQHPGEVMVH